VPIRDIRHGETRSNIPTAELESFADDEEKRPTIVRYPRDTTLDPQLVWKGKDEQDASDLAVPAVPIYIQETIDPLRLIEELRAESEAASRRRSWTCSARSRTSRSARRWTFYHHPAAGRTG